MKLKRIVNIISVYLIVVAFFLPLSLTAQSNTEQKEEKMEWFDNAGFGVFIHWGLYSEAAGYWNGVPVGGLSEWIMSNAHIPQEDYEELSKGFNPVQFDANQWADIVKESGAKYVVVTTKHHDGYSMFDTDVSDYNIVDQSPWHQDPMAELSKAFENSGVKFSTYYSIMDWHSPYQEAKDPSSKNPTYNPTTVTDNDKYVQYMKDQLNEIVTQYHPHLIWFDGGWIKNWTKDNAQDIYDYLMELDPKLVVNNRLTHDVGDYGTPEQEIPEGGLSGSWETCMTIGDNWGFADKEQRFKSSEELITNLVKVVSGGGNYLLNIGPSSQGFIRDVEVERLKAIGQWLKVNGEAIYGAKRTPFDKDLSYGYATQKPGKIYLEITQWPRDGEIEVPLKNELIKAYLLADKGKQLEVKSSSSGKLISLPRVAPDPVASVIVLEIEGEVSNL